MLRGTCFPAFRAGFCPERAVLALAGRVQPRQSPRTGRPDGAAGSNQLLYRYAAPNILMPMPRQSGRLGIQVHGHRGARAKRPENSIPAFQYAIEQGADAIEMDLAVTKDNAVIISHDPILGPPLCAGPSPQAVIRELTLAEVRQWDCGAAMPGTRIPTLDEVLQLAGQGDFDYNLEIKSFPEHPEYAPPPDEFAGLVLAAIRRHSLGRRTIVQSFDFRTLVAMRKQAPEIPLSALTEDDPRDFAAIAQSAGGTEMVSPHFALITPEKVKAAHNQGLRIMAWTANTPAAWAALAHAGVDAIITDDPAALIAYLAGQGLR